MFLLGNHRKSLIFAGFCRFRETIFLVENHRLCLMLCNFTARPPKSYKRRSLQHSASVAFDWSYSQHVPAKNSQEAGHSKQNSLQEEVEFQPKPQPSTTQESPPRRQRGKSQEVGRAASDGCPGCGEGCHASWGSRPSGLIGW